MIQQPTLALPAELAEAFALRSMVLFHSNTDMSEPWFSWKLNHTNKGWSVCTSVISLHLTPESVSWVVHGLALPTRFTVT